MVLWEITLGTAYFLGLKRTYRLALRIQRRVISSKYPKIRGFLHRRTRAIFDVALRVHLNIQQRDLEVGRNVGNWILRWLDRMKPEAQIRGDGPPKPPTGGGSTTKLVTNSSGRQPPGTTQRSNYTNADKRSDGRVFASSLNIRSRPLPTLSTMMRPFLPTAASTQFRHLSICGPHLPRSNFGSSSVDGVIRKDIMQWMLQN